MGDITNRAIHLPRSPHRLNAREVASTDARMVTISTPTTSVTNKRCGFFRSDSTSAPRALLRSLSRRRSRGLKAKREVSAAAKKM